MQKLWIFRSICKDVKKTKKATVPNKQSKQTNFNRIESTPDKSNDEQSVIYITGYRELNEQKCNSNNDSDLDNYVAAFSIETANKLEPHNAKTQFVIISLISMIDSGKVCSIITKSLAGTSFKTTPTAQWSTSIDMKDLKNFSSDPNEAL